MDYEALHRRAREKGVNRVVLFIVRLILTPFFLIYLRMKRIGREYIPAQGPVVLASNHRSFFDPFVIGTMTRRPVYYVAKKELFGYSRILSWLLNALGAFPVDRGAGDQETIETAEAILNRGEIVLMFPEGTRTRPGSLGRPRRGVGRLALETGAPVVPIAIIGTEDIRRGWRIRPRKVRVRAGRPLNFPKVEDASPSLAGAVHRPDLADGDAPVGVARRHAADPARGGHRWRRRRHKPGGAAGAGGARRSSWARTRASRRMRSRPAASTTTICRASNCPTPCTSPRPAPWRTSPAEPPYLQRPPATG